MRRSLALLELSDNHLDWKFARTVYSTLLDASSTLTALNLSDNNVWDDFFHFNLFSFLLGWQQIVNRQSCRYLDGCLISVADQVDYFHHQENANLCSRYVFSI